MRRWFCILIPLGIGFAFGLAGCSDRHISPPAAAMPPEPVRGGEAGDRMPTGGNIPGGMQSAAIEVHILCDEEKLPTGLLDVRGFLWNSADKRWRIGSGLVRTDELERYLAGLVEELKPAGILVHDSDKAGCKEFDAGLAVLVEFCAKHNTDLFKTIPTGNGFCAEFMCAALWLVQARPLSPAGEELVATLLGNRTSIICDAEKLDADWLRVVGDTTASDWAWRIGELRLTPVELDSYLESRLSELRTIGILVSEVGSPPDGDSRPPIESLYRFCRRRNIDLVQAIPTRGSFSRDFDLPAVWLIQSQPIKPSLRRFETAYEEYLHRESNGGQETQEAMELAWPLAESLRSLTQ